MPFIRLSDNYIDHPKFTALSDGAFRLWHEAMAFCRRHQTDGLIPEAGMKQFPTFRKDRLQHLLRPYRDGKHALLEAVPDFGYKVHDYLEWNLSRDEEQSDQSGAAARMRKFRARQQMAAALSSSSDVTPFVTPSSEHVTNAFVPDMDRERDLSSERGSGGKPPPSALIVTDLEAHRAAALLRSYEQWYAKYRHGAKLRLKPALDHDRAIDLVRLWSDPELETLAQIVLTTDDDWISRTDRGFGIFAAKASWADDRLQQAKRATG